MPLLSHPPADLPPDRSDRTYKSYMMYLSYRADHSRSTPSRFFHPRNFHLLNALPPHAPADGVEGISAFGDASEQVDGHGALRHRRARVAAVEPADLGELLLDDPGGAG